MASLDWSIGMIIVDYKDYGFVGANGIIKICNSLSISLAKQTESTACEFLALLMIEFNLIFSMSRMPAIKCKLLGIHEVGEFTSDELRA